MNTKEKAEKLVENHRLLLYDLDDTTQAIHHAIISIEYTIEVLEIVKERQELDTFYLNDEIKYQTKILNELKSRI